MHRVALAPRRLPLAAASARALSQPAVATSGSLISSFRDVVFGPQAPPMPPTPAFPASCLLPARPTHVTTLNNGLRVASEASAGSEMATVGIWVDTGSRYEGAANNGTAHFLEHMAFKGTSGRSQADLEREAESMGATFNAYTSREHTVYFARCFRNDVKYALNVIADNVQNPLFDEKAIDRERGVILREMEEVDLQHSELIMDKLHQMAFRGSSLGRSIIGPTENVQAIVRDDLVKFVKTHYSTDRIVVSGAGGINHEDLCKWAGEAFSGLPSSTPEGLSVHDGGKPYFIGSDIRMREDDMEDCHFAFAFEGLPWAHPDSPVLSVMVAILGVWDARLSTNAHTACKLAREVGADNLAKSVTPFATPYNDTGLFGVYCVADPYKLPELSWVVQEEVTRLCFEVQEEDVRRAVNMVKASLATAPESSQGVFEDIGRQMLTVGRRVSLKEMFDRLDRITPADVNRVATSLVYDRDLVVSALGPVVKLPDYNRFRRRTFWLRY